MTLKVAVGCGACGQRGKLDLDKVGNDLRCRCGSEAIEMLDGRRDVKHARRISIEAVHPTYTWVPDLVGDAWRCITPTGQVLVVDLDISSGFYGTIESATGDVLHQVHLSTDNLSDAKGHLEVAYAEDFLVRGNERVTEQSFGSKTADTQNIDQSTDDICPRCGGTGNDPQEPDVRCVTCGGSGKLGVRVRRDAYQSRQARIATDILRHNPGVSLGKAASLAREVERRYLARSR